MKAGDIVRCVDSAPEGTGLKRGKEYRVARTFRGNQGSEPTLPGTEKKLGCCVEGTPGFFFQDRFEVVS